MLDRDMEDILPVLKGLADNTRFNIILLLLQNDLCVGGLANRLGLSKAAVSQHLQILRKAGLVIGEKRGYWTHYSVRRETLEQVAQRLSLIAKSPGSGMHQCFLGMQVRQPDVESKSKRDICSACCREPLEPKNEDTGNGKRLISGNHSKSSGGDE